MGHTQNTYCNGDCDSFKIKQNINGHFWLTSAVDHSDYLPSSQRQQWRGKSHICNKNINVRLAFAYQSLILALVNSANKHKHHLILFHQAIGFRPMLAASAEENLSTFQTGAALAGVSVRAHLIQQLAGRRGGSWLPSTLPPGRRTLLPLHSANVIEPSQLASPPGTGCFFPGFAS